MKHNQIFQGLIGDLISQVQLQNVNGKSVARTRVGFIEKRQVNGQWQEYKASFSAEAWGDVGKRLASIPTHHTIMFNGKYQNYKFKGQDGQERWGVKITMLNVADCGPSAHNYQQQGQQQQTGNQQANTTGYPPQNAPQGQNPGYGAAPQSGYPPQNNQSGGQQNPNPPQFDSNEQIPF